MNDKEVDPGGEQEQPSRIPFVVAVSALAAMGLFWFLSGAVSGRGTVNQLLTCVFLLSQVVVISLVIWQACDPFADAAQWIGKTLRIPGSVRGATLDAIASSMPELFTGIFFVVIALSSSEASQERLVEQAGDGYGAAIATCAGSAVYNMILIPAICGLVISYTRKSRPTIDVESAVITRDGLWFIGAELLLITFLFQDKMYWWMGLTMLGVYFVYVLQLYRDAQRYRKAHDAVVAHLDEVDDIHDSEQIARVLRQDGFHVTPLLVETVRDRMDEDEENEEENGDSAEILFGAFSIPLNHRTAWLIIAMATLLAAASCYWLVQVTEHTAGAFGQLANREIPVFFVAVIIAAAASSVPDTFLSIGSARRGDDSGAVSNAFGSNIFDICICLSVPLIISSSLLGWKPIELTQAGEPMAGLVDLRILLVSLSFITLLIMWHQRQLTRAKSFVLVAMYGLFTAYAVLGSLGYTIFE